MRLYVANKETGAFIEEITSIEEGLAIINQYEATDKLEGIYTPNFYDIVDENYISKM